jgi:cytochrome c-type biogenesis protein CcmH
MRSRQFPLWTLLGVVLVVALLAGSGVFSSAPKTNAQRAASVEAVIRCPSCQDLSVAVSTAPTAITVRATVAHLVDQGRSDQQIKDYLVARYGSAIVLDPSTRGWSALVWVLPIAGGLAGLAALVVVLVRRRRRGTGGLDADVRGPEVDPVALEERRHFLTQSLADADAEYLAGDLEDGDYLVLRQRDLGRLAALGPRTATTASWPVVATTGAATPSTTLTAEVIDDAAAVPGSPGLQPSSRRSGGRSRSGRNKWFLIGSIGCFVAAMAVAVPLFAHIRLPGQTATGSVSLSPSQQVSRSLDQAAAVENLGQLGQAAQLYQTILTSHPDNEVALVQLGWLEYRIGRQGASSSLIGDARVKLGQAATLNPGDYAVHLYLGTLMLQQEGNVPGAVDQFTQFLASKPPVTVLSEAASVLRQAYTAVGKPIPFGIPSA